MTIHNVSRAAAVRMFKAAKTYRLVSRTRADGKGTPDIDSTIRTIERVTSTGVYVSGGPSYAMTQLNDRDVTFHTDEAGNLLLIARTAEGAEFMRLTYELDPSEPEAAGTASVDVESVDGAAVIAAVGRLAEVAAQMYDSEALGGLTCQEVEAIADVLRSAGHAEPADTLIEAHAHGDDDEEDQHHGRFLTIQAEHAVVDTRISAESATAGPGPLVYASRTPRELNNDPNPFVGWDALAGGERRASAPFGYADHAPRPEFDRSQRNRPNPILVRFRQWVEGESLIDPCWSREWLEAMSDPQVESDAAAALDALYESPYRRRERAEEEEHARRVIGRVLRLACRAAGEPTPHVPYPGEGYIALHDHDWADGTCQAVECAAVLGPHD